MVSFAPPNPFAIGQQLIQGAFANNFLPPSPQQVNSFVNQQIDQAQNLVTGLANAIPLPGNPAQVFNPANPGAGSASLGGVVSSTDFNNFARQVTQSIAQLAQQQAQLAGQAGMFFSGGCGQNPIAQGPAVPVVIVNGPGQGGGGGGGLDPLTLLLLTQQSGSTTTGLFSNPLMLLLLSQGGLGGGGGLGGNSLLPFLLLSRPAA